MRDLGRRWLAAAVSAAHTVAPDLELNRDLLIGAATASATAKEVEIPTEEVAIGVLLLVRPATTIARRLSGGAAEAHRRGQTGRTAGKLVLTVVD